MKKVFNINVGGYPFIIDDDAFEHLEAYFDAIRRQFRDSDSAEEIVSDIEARVAEIFQERLDNARTILSMKDIEAVVAIMGRPEEFEDDSDFDYAKESAESMGAKSTYKVGKRLLRNPDDKVLGGVCSGLTAYFGIEDSIWIRLAFVFLFVFMGVGLIPYLLLWIVIPEAKNASDKLAMRGEPINIDSISEKVEKEVSHLTNKINQFGNSNKDDKKKKVNNSEQESPKHFSFSGK